MLLGRLESVALVRVEHERYPLTAPDRAADPVTLLRPPMPVPAHRWPQRRRRDP